MRITVKLDTSPKRFVGNKPYYFLGENADFKNRSGYTSHMTYNQACAFAEGMKELGVEVVDCLEILGF